MEQYPGIKAGFRNWKRDLMLIMFASVIGPAFDCDHFAPVTLACSSPGRHKTRQTTFF